MSGTRTPRRHITTPMRKKNELLRTSDALKGHRTEIASFFADHEDKNERADFIKTFFDNTFTEMILSNGQRAGYRAFDTVFMMWRGSASDPEQRVIMKWSTVCRPYYRNDRAA